jgi:hypothetical protein
MLGQIFSQLSENAKKKRARYKQLDGSDAVDVAAVAPKSARLVHDVDESEKLLRAIVEERSAKRQGLASGDADFDARLVALLSIADIPTTLDGTDFDYDSVYELANNVTWRDLVSLIIAYPTYADMEAFKNELMQYLEHSKIKPIFYRRLHTFLVGKLKEAKSSSNVAGLPPLAGTPSSVASSSIASTPSSVTTSSVASTPSRTLSTPPRVAGTPSSVTSSSDASARRAKVGKFTAPAAI